MAPLAVRDLELDLDAFEGPFDLLLTVVLKEELALADVEIAAIVLAFVERLAEHSPLDLDSCGEFLVLVGALLELKGRELLPGGLDEDDLAELDPDEAAEELAERLALYRRFKEAAGWLEQRLEVESDRFFRVGPAPLAPVPHQRLAPQDPEQLVAALRALASEPAEPSLAHLRLALPPLSRFLDRFRGLLAQQGRFLFDREVAALSRVEQAVAFLALLELARQEEAHLGQSGPFEPITVWSARSR